VLQHEHSLFGNPPEVYGQRVTEPFSSSDLAVLKDMDGFGQLLGAPGTAAELAQDAPRLELGIGPLGGRARLGVGAVGVFLGSGLATAAIGDADGVAGAAGP
jgi:hypothetical protein